MKSKLIDCITFFQENFIFNLRYKILKDVINEFIVCESIYDHRGRKKKLNFDKKFIKKKKIRYLIYKKKFPSKNSPWQNQALQREFILKNLGHINNEDYIYSHKWDDFDLIIWDNRSMVHRGQPYDITEPRYLVRATVSDTMSTGTYL